MQEIITKLKFRGAATVVNAPAGLAEQFTKAGCKTALAASGKTSDTLVFVNNSKEYTDFLKKQLKKIEPDSVLWFAYPKGKSGIKTDINRDTLRVTGEEYGITTVTAISIDDTWSGLRFRPVDKVGT